MIPLIFSFIFALVVALVFWHNRIWALSLVLFFLPSYLVRFHFLEIPFTMLESGILSLFFMFLLQEIFFRKENKQATLFSFKKHPYLVIGLSMFILTGIFGLLTTPNLSAGLGIFKAYLIEPLLFFVVLVKSVKTSKDWHWLLGALGSIAILTAVITIGQYFLGWGIPASWHDLPGRRATAFYGYPNAVGLFLAPICAFFIGTLPFWAQFKKLQRWFVLSVIILTLVAIFLSHAEGALVALGISVVVVVFFTKWRWLVIGISTIILILALILPFTREILFFQDVSGQVRLALWQGTFHLLKAQPIFGAGLGGFPQTYDLYRLPAHVELLLYPHNIFLDFWVELGIIGLGLFLMVLGLIFFWLIKKILKNQQQHFLLPLLGVFVCVVIYGLVDVPYFKNDLAVLFWTWLGLVVLSKK
ncbi:MAG: hypothetical protein A2233_01270 [Candidatus Kerfeldbacteria bacterium RIFOXYA2_FULL_38_24]|uniref:O-antigen ligase-related domain-containing protein n=1 Tax=Candidatus Kerfeldbacteria bacterium RIFOXYB2_FULL_38_14 TaxID=1798547 RepID=A0A1G2BEA0_9BACT|nr:MAG: hypothetical protein A2233_01270 [Candidatus Kerfeldbacteria bacterium RIFOXYA2_FULL_38_24]OGY87365.1 MAG: hypothetical protein A2319_05360 [Candidatus Kerfeldbacteria bacterium RIFOXYB2_FULL_38_14]OGY90493.1 MAG: hypothetical protein A2458_04620 [Candidatus Kerfeldbacteria bacterium RIFOXYC2_FULL_38_9]